AEAEASTAPQIEPQKEKQTAPEVQTDEQLQAQLANHPHVKATLHHLAGQAAQVETVRTRYEAALSAVFMNAFQPAIAEFADLKTQADVQALAATNPDRYVRFLQTVQQIGVARDELGKIQQARETEQRASFQNYATDQDTRFEKAHPELSNKAAQATAV